MKIENLSTILLKLHSALIELEALLIEEVSQLRRTKINPVSLQVVSDNKRQLLSTISHYDDLRKQQEVSLKISAPYHNNPRIAASWDEVVTKIKSVNQLNANVAELLELHMQKSERLAEIMGKSGSAVPVYAANGQSGLNKTGKVYNFSV